MKSSERARVHGGLEFSEPGKDISQDSLKELAIRGELLKSPQSASIYRTGTLPGPVAKALTLPGVVA